MEKILEYQRIEGELINIDKKINQSNSMKAIAQFNDSSNTAKNEMKELDKKAGELVNAFHKLEDIMQKNINNIRNLEKQKVEASDKEQMKKLYENIKTVNDNLNIIEKRLSDINKNIDLVLKKFQKNKALIANAKDKKVKAQNDLEEYKKSFDEQKNKLQKELEKLQKEITPNVFELYQRVRKENIYPVFVKALQENNQTRCGKCKSIIPVARIDKLKNQGYIECEECRRIILLDKKD